MVGDGSLRRARGTLPTPLTAWLWIEARAGIGPQDLSQTSQLLRHLLPVPRSSQGWAVTGQHRMSNCSTPSGLQAFQIDVTLSVCLLWENTVLIKAWSGLLSTVTSCAFVLLTLGRILK